MWCSGKMDEKIAIEKVNSDVVNSSKTNQKEVIVEVKSATVIVDMKKWKVVDTLQECGLMTMIREFVWIGGILCLSVTCLCLVFFVNCFLIKTTFFSTLDIIHIIVG